MNDKISNEDVQFIDHKEETSTNKSVKKPEKNAESVKKGAVGSHKGKPLRQSTIDETLFGRRPPPASFPSRVAAKRSITVSKTVAKQSRHNRSAMSSKSFGSVITTSDSFSRDEVQNLHETLAENAKRKPFKLRSRRSSTGSMENGGSAKENATLAQSLISDFLLSQPSPTEEKKSVTSRQVLTREADEKLEQPMDTEPCSISEASSNLSQEHLGADADSLMRTPQCRACLPSLSASQASAVLVSVQSIGDASPPKVFPDSPTDATYGWNSGQHVRLPCSSESRYPSRDQSGLVDRWPLVQAALSRAPEWTRSQDVIGAILSYNSRNSERWSFGMLQDFFEKGVDAATSKRYMNELLPKMAELALRLPELITQPLPLLRKCSETELRSVTLSQEQAACLLANAFFCTFPCRNSRPSTFPDINFNGLFVRRADRGIEKLRCVFHYFDRVISSMPRGLLTFERRSLEVFPDWVASSKPLRRLHVNFSGTIEDDGRGFLQSDFANKYLGGGVLRYGCVQEEIRFIICPELIISCLLTEVLSANECLVMKGAERFSNYSGYANSFKWAGDCVDDIERDEWGRKETEIVAIDALPGARSSQFKQEKIFRELNKAYVGFSRSEERSENLSAIATGNWGCGAFGGDKELKSILQLMAASEAGRDVAYYTFRDRDFMKRLHSVHSHLCRKQLTVGSLCKLVVRYGEIVASSGGHPDLSLFDYILADDSN